MTLERGRKLRLVAMGAKRGGDVKRQHIKQPVTSPAVGCAGELVAQARLLMRGWLVGNINRGGMMNAPAVDLMAAIQ